MSSGNDCLKESGMKLTLFEKQVFETFVAPGEVVEVRIPRISGRSWAWGNEWAHGVVSGYFDHFDTFCKTLREVDKHAHEGIYFSLQRIDNHLEGTTFA